MPTNALDELRAHRRRLIRARTRANNRNDARARDRAIAALAIVNAEIQRLGNA